MTWVVPIAKITRRFRGTSWGGSYHNAWTCDYFVDKDSAQGSGYSSRVGARFIRRLS